MPCQKRECCVNGAARSLAKTLSISHFVDCIPLCKRQNYLSSNSMIGNYGALIILYTLTVQLNGWFCLDELWLIFCVY